MCPSSVHWARGFWPERTTGVLQPAAGQSPLGLSMNEGGTSEDTSSPDPLCSASFNTGTLAQPTVTQNVMRFCPVLLSWCKLSWYARWLWPTDLGLLHSLVHRKSTCFWESMGKWQVYLLKSFLLKNKMPNDTEGVEDSSDEPEKHRHKHGSPTSRDVTKQAFCHFSNDTLPPTQCYVRKRGTWVRTQGCHML